MNKSLTYTCLFGGGAIRGVSYIGAIKALEDLNVEVPVLGGSSVGSIFAALLSVGYTSDELNQIFSKVNFNLFRDISLGIGPFFALSKGEVFLDWIRELIERKFYGEDYQKGANKAVTFNDISKDLVIITTDLGNFECKEFSKNETPDFEIASAVRISCCMPGLMKPIEYNNRLLVDGDLQKSWPMWKLSQSLKNSSDRIIEFRLEGYYETNDISGIDYANAVYSCMTASSTSFVIDIYGQKDRYDYIVLNTGNIVIVDFNINEEKRNDLIKSGYEQTVCYFRTNLVEKKLKLQKYYKKLEGHLSKIEKFIQSRKIFKAKAQLGDLYIDLCEVAKYIDKIDLNNINKFKDDFMNNINYPSLFGRATLHNEKMLKDEIEQMLAIFRSKLEEYDSYLKVAKRDIFIDN